MHIRLFRFSMYELDVVAGDLRRRGVRIKLQGQPMQVLCLLLERAGQTVSRQELHDAIWGPGYKVDSYGSLGVAIAKVRAALGDSASKPTFVETVLGENGGFRFIAPVTRVNAPLQPILGDPEAPPELEGLPDANSETNGSCLPVGTTASLRSRMVALATVVVVFVIFVSGYARRAAPPRFAEHSQILTVALNKAAVDPSLINAMLTAFRIDLEQDQSLTVLSEEHLDPVLKRMGESGDALTRTSAREACEREGIRGLVNLGVWKVGPTYVLSAELIDPQNDLVISSHRVQAGSDSELISALDRLGHEVRLDLGESLKRIRATDRSLAEVTTPSLVALKAYSAGKELWRRGAYTGAISQYQTALAADPHFAMAHAALAGAYSSYVGNRSDLAAREYKEAIRYSDHATERERLSILVYSAINMRDDVQSERSLRAFLDLYPDDGEMLFRYSQLLREHGRYAEALPNLHRLSLIDPLKGSVYVEIASCHRSLGQFAEALQAYEKAFQLEPGLNKFSISREYGITLLVAGREAEAERFFTAQLSDPQTRETGLRSLVLLDTLHGRLTTAEKSLAEARSIDDANRNYLSLSRIQLSMAGIALLRSDSAAERNHLVAARTLVAASRPNPVIASWVGTMFARTGSVRSAQQLASLARTSVDSQNRMETGYLHLLQGEIAASEKDFATAREMLMLAREEMGQDADNPWILEALARETEDEGHLDQAIGYYEKLTRLSLIAVLWEPLPEWLRAHLSLANAYLHRGAPGDRERARGVLDALLSYWADGDKTSSLYKDALALRSSLA